MTAAARRQDAGAAVAGLFARPSATGGLAGRDEAVPTHASEQQPIAREPRVRLGDAQQRGQRDRPLAAGLEHV